MGLEPDRIWVDQERGLQVVDLERRLQAVVLERGLQAVVLGRGLQAVDLEQGLQAVDLERELQAEALEHGVRDVGFVRELLLVLLFGLAGVANYRYLFPTRLVMGIRFALVVA